MTKHSEFDFSGIKGYSLFDRPSKVTVDDFAKIPADDSVSSLIESLPRILAAEQFSDLINRIRHARSRKKAIIWGFGGHVIKTGLAPLIIDLMERGFVTALATNGSGVIHDFEIAIAGKTSEDVDAQLGPGRFGMAEETGHLMNSAIREGYDNGLGIGESLGEYLNAENLSFGRHSILLQSFRNQVPLTVHVAIGTDIIHMHPSASGEAIGGGSLTDFRIFTRAVSDLDGGGVYINLGSTVVLPEVFLKAVSVVRASGRTLSGFTTANFDFIQHYRPQQNVVKRPVQGSGKGISITGHHELMIPLLAACLRKSEPNSE